MALLEQEDVGAVRILAMNRPERRNALSGALVDALLQALDAADADTDVRCVVLTGRGEAFCAGGDLADGIGGDGGFIDGHLHRGRYAAALARMPSLRVPVIAAVNGIAYGGGLGLVAAADLAVADVTAKLGTPEIRLGLFPWIILAALQRDVPRKRLMEMVLTGSSITADEGKDIGLVNRVVEAGTSLDAAVELGWRVASASPVVLRLGKAAFHRIYNLGYEDALAYMHTQLSLNLLTEDAAEGVTAFLQKRPPSWKGR